MGASRAETVIGDHRGHAIQGPVLITGGAGFIGTNLAARLLGQGREVIIFDNMSRRGVAENLRWLADVWGPRLRTSLADIREANVLREAVQRAGCVFHFAAQVAVTSSLEDPLTDFEVNLRGTLNLLEALRHARRRIPLVFASTNKVYGGLEDVELVANGTRYQPVDEATGKFGIDESRPLQFCSPHGCSTGAADQYILDYARSFGIPAVVLRMSCIYGPHQCGSEDQGWIAHFLLRAMQDEPITIFGDGMQVRDILYIDDLVDALVMCGQDRDALRGRAFNLGGGARNTLSPRELLGRIATLVGRTPRTLREDWRVGDPRYYVSDTRCFGAATGWRSRVDAAKGIEQLFGWLLRNASIEDAGAARMHAA